MSRSVVVMCMGGVGHVQVLMPVIEGLRRRGCHVRVMTKAEFREKIEAAGADFVDLFAEYSLDAADATSVPLPSRFVSFAAVYAAALAKEISGWEPELIVYDTFTVAAPVVARLLDVPYVNVCPNHAPVPARVVAALHQDPRVAISAECRAAVERLRSQYGLHDASPFYYVQALSPFLNLYCEPPEFLAAEDHAAFEPVEFFGALPFSAKDAIPAVDSTPCRDRPNVYVSFGTGVFRYFESVAVEALAAISRSLADEEVRLVISLGGFRLEGSARQALEQRNTVVTDYVDQWRALQETDVFITHHGVNSTHESIFWRVPMISYPFFGDQPALARRCQELGLALPLTESPRQSVDPDKLRAAVARLIDERTANAARLDEARSWELRMMANREAVLDRVLALR
jgi:MGT family glycosyltransferase